MVTFNNVSMITPTVSPVLNSVAPKIAGVKDDVQKQTEPAPSSQVALTPASKMTPVSGQTSVEFTSDPNTGKSVINVISKDDNRVIRSIPSPVPMSLVAHHLDKIPQSLVDAIL
jgi:hypothetical protein